MVRSQKLLRLALRPGCLRQEHISNRRMIFPQRRSKATTVLGIETSADDTCVVKCVFDESPSGECRAQLLQETRVTCPNRVHRGIHPVEAVAHHTKHLSPLVKGLIGNTNKPDLICVTRGPGMGGCLSVGVTTAKALSDVWDVPIVGVHHMQAHALTPHLEDMLAAAFESERAGGPVGQEPILTLLVSGKHTMLVHTKSPTDHRILATTKTTALGDVLDKFARELVPPEFIPCTNDAVCYPYEMEVYTSHLETPTHHSVRDLAYRPPTSRQEELKIYQSDYTWQLKPPLRESRALEFEFESLRSAALEILQARPDMPEGERKALGRHTMRLAFEHIIGRVLLAMESDEELKRNPPKTLVLSGGVARNLYLTQIAIGMLRTRGHNLRVVRPKKKWCQDNAAMIAATGWMMYKDGWETDKAFAPQVKWSIEEIMTGVDCWVRRPGFPPLSLEDAQGGSPNGVPKEIHEGLLEEYVEYIPEQRLEETSEEIQEDIQGETLFQVEAPAPSLSASITQYAPQNKDGVDRALEQILSAGEAYLQHVEIEPAVEETTHKGIGTYRYKRHLLDVRQRAAKVFALAEATAQQSIRGAQSFRDPEELNNQDISHSPAHRLVQSFDRRNRNNNLDDHSNTMSSGNGDGKAPLTMKKQRAMNEAVEAEIFARINAKTTTQADKEEGTPNRSSSATKSIDKADEAAPTTFSAWRKIKPKQPAEAATATPAKALDRTQPVAPSTPPPPSPARKSHGPLLEPILLNLQQEAVDRTQAARIKREAELKKAASAPQSAPTTTTTTTPTTSFRRTEGAPPPPAATTASPAPAKANVVIARARNTRIRKQRRNDQRQLAADASRISSAMREANKVWPVVPERRDRHAIKVRFVGHADADTDALASKGTSVVGRITSVFGGWFGGK